MRLTRAFTLLQARAIARRIDGHFGLNVPVRAAPLNGGIHAPIAATYSPGAVGWTARHVRVVRIASRNEFRLHVGSEVEALEGTNVGGAVLDVGPFAWFADFAAPNETPDENV